MNPSQTLSSPLILDSVEYRWPGETSPVVSINRLELGPGERVLLTGPSGSGKSTLLNIIAGVLPPDTGTVKVGGTDVAGLSARQRDRFRGDHIGLIFQAFNLLPYLSVIDNVRLPCKFSKLRGKRAQQADAADLLTSLGLEPETFLRTAVQLSVGQQQRVAAARALIGSPDLIVADEPTSALDEENAQRFLDVLFRACDVRDTALLMVSHDRRLASAFDRVVALADLRA